MALDQGTTSSRAILFDKKGQVKALAQREFEQCYPRPGWVEHNPDQIWESQITVLIEAIAKAQVSWEEVAALGITNQRETTIVWDRATGIPVYNAIVWQDRRTAARCEALRQQGWEKMIQAKTGLVLDAYFSATKIQWILENVPEARTRAEKGALAFGTIDSWLIWKLTKGQQHATDVSNASRTMLFNIHRLTWDKELLDIFQIPEAMLPEVKSCAEWYGDTQTDLLKTSLPITGVAGDQQAALFGQMCIDKGMVKNTYGTGCFMVLNTGEQVIRSQNQLLSTIAWQLNGQTTYALEGSVFIAGAVIQWLRDGLKIIQSAPESESLALEKQDNGGVVFVPALSGLGAPHWNPNARGMMIGITRGTTSAHITRAALESIVLQTKDVLDAMVADTQSPITELRVDGGAVANNLLMQLQADIGQFKVVRPQTLETTALGAAYFAGLAVGFWKDIDAIKTQWQANQIFSPQMPLAEAKVLERQWQKALRRAKDWADED
ncbi:MAG: glycerol kinase GlpK [Microscillaceae bacterium]